VVKQTYVAENKDIPMIDKFNEKSMREIKSAIEIQRRWRGYKSRRNLLKTKEKKPELNK
jgi:hypothetical protein